jgi:DUF971 family protein
MTPTDIALHQASRLLELTWPDGETHQLPCELLRVYSPSAEVRGHGVGNATLQTGKEQVNITAIDPIGHYAIKITFDDGHDSGLFDWGYLRDLGDNQTERWADYLSRCDKANYIRNTEQSDQS